MASRLERFMESIGLKVTKEQLQYLQTLADQQQKPLAEGCREVLLGSTKRPTATVFEQALMAETAAMQRITISMISEVLNGLGLSKERVHRILNNQHVTEVSRRGRAAAAGTC